MNTDLALSEVVLDSELRHVNFFNGRLLTGGDLTAEQNAEHAHGRLLGLALGTGVAHGLEVSPAPGGTPTVLIAAGLAVNRQGQTLRLACPQRVALTRPPAAEAADACVFGNCGPTAAGGTLATGAGYYVLTIAPAARPEEQAPVTGLGNDVATCNSRYLTEGVRFQLHLLNVPPDATPRARSLLAAACFGLPLAISTGPWPGSLPGPHRWETLMPTGFAADAEVPLAVLQWTSQGLGFIKNWAVRRRLARPEATGGWDYFPSERRAAEGEARWLDFQDDLAALAPKGFAGDSFTLLPPGAVLPADFDWHSFLGPLAPPAVTPIDAALWARLLRDTFTRESASVTAAPRPAYKVYRVPDRAELLLARSTLGRLRLLRQRDDAQLLAVLLRAADGSWRSYAMTQKNSSTLLIDDLPGGPAQLWFLRGNFAPTPPVRHLEQVTNNLNAAVKSEAQARAESTRATTELNLAVAGTGWTVRPSSVLRLVKQTAAALNAGEGLRAANEKVAVARAELDQLNATLHIPQPGVAPLGSPFDHLEGALTSDVWLALLRGVRTSSPADVELVQGQITELTIPHEKGK